MVITIKNFGPIGSLTFDINKDLNLIYGKNAIGKSYATYCLYNLIKNIKDKTPRRRYISIDYFEKSPLYNKFLNKIRLVKENSPQDITKIYKDIINEELSSVILETFNNSLLNTFSSLENLKNKFSNKHFSIEIIISEMEHIIISYDGKSISLEYENNIYENIELYYKNTKTTKYSLYLNGKIVYGKPNEELFSYEFQSHINGRLYDILNKLDNNIRDVYYLPASRSGLYQALNAFTPIIAELTQSRFFIQNKSIELPSLSEPLSDYFIDLSTLEKKNLNKDFQDIIDILQKDILKGNVDYNDKTKRIIYRPEKVNIDLNLSEASSMVAELSPLVLYFKHIINHKYSALKNNRFFIDSFSYRKYNSGYDILFIEEPEAHLHPEIQVKLMELFVKLTGKKLKIFITSHSNYMFNKLNNLIIMKEINPEIVKVYHLINEPKIGSINGEMEVSDEGINDENFQDISEKLYMERLNYYSSND